MARSKNIIQILMPLLSLYPWSIPAITILGILSSFSEGFSISLFIPLLQNLEQSDTQPAGNNSWADWLNQLFSQVPSDDRFLAIAASIFIFILLKTGLAYGNSVLFSWYNSRISNQLRTQVFRQLLSINYSFIENNESGKLMNTLTTETWQTSRGLAVLVNLITTLSTAFVYIVLLLLISWQLTLLVTAVMTLISLIIRVVTRRVKTFGQQAVKINAAMSQRMLEGLGGMKLIRLFGRESYEQHRFEQQSQQVSTIFFKLEILSGVVNPLFEILTATLLVGILLIASQAQIALPTLLTFIFLLYRLQPKIKQLDSARVSLRALSSSIEDVMSLLDCADKPYIRTGCVPFQGLQQAIRFEAVTFSYNSESKPALQNVSLTIPQGKTTALVGPSGAGKSTLISLTCRLYEATVGEIYADDRPLWEFELNSWRDRIAIVSQDIYIFSTTIRENIAYGRLDATDDEIIAAAKLANAHTFIMELPNNYDTQVGDYGMRLSGGQRQRIALARAIVRNPDILILDEATNALDSISESLIQEALDTLSQDRTVIVIAHRLSTIEQADQIVVMNEGRVTEQGNLQHLLALNGLFAKLYDLQYGSVRT